MRKRKLDGKESDVYFNGSKVPEKKLKKQMSRHFTLTQGQLFDTTPLPSTPEAITVSTPKATEAYVASSPNLSQSGSAVLSAPTADLNMDHSLDSPLPQYHPLPLISPYYREDWDTIDRSIWHPQAGEDMQAVRRTKSLPTAGGNKISSNPPCFRLQTLLESTGQ